MISEDLIKLLDSLKDSNMKITITIEPKGGLTAEEVEKARKAGHEGKEIQFICLRLNSLLQINNG
jgi:hypothetical protein